MRHASNLYFYFENIMLINSNVKFNDCKIPITTILFEGTEYVNVSFSLLTHALSISNTVPLVPLPRIIDVCSIMIFFRTRLLTISVTCIYDFNWYEFFFGFVVLLMGLFLAGTDNWNTISRFGTTYGMLS